MEAGDVRIPRVLSIAGSDSGGGAGIQADLKAFARCGVHGMTALTAVTWQNTVSVDGVTPLPPAAIIGQVRAVASDIGVDAVKIGMLGDAETIAAVRAALDLVPDALVVLDPVMVAESGAPLLAPEARQALLELLPRAAVVTPNLLEARALVEQAGGDATADVPALTRAIATLGPANAVVTGGHTTDADSVDYFSDGEDVVPIPGPRYANGAAHGSGCTHSAALAAHLALGHSPLEAAVAAKVIASEAVRDGLRQIGAGPGPVDVLDVAGRAAQQAGLARPSPAAQGGRTRSPLP
jgi:hydroxymethylpyrimidine/phosphomethylpyrimidine kinase